MLTYMIPMSLAGVTVFYFLPLLPFQKLSLPLFTLEILHFGSVNFSLVNISNLNSSSRLKQIQASLPVNQRRVSARELSYTIGLKSASYLDVPQDWYTNAVEYVTIRGLFAGYNGNFTPNGTMTRAMFVQVLANLEGTTLIKGDYWYSGAVAWAQRSGIIGNIEPSQVISREEMAVILCNYIKYKGIELNVVNDKPFADINDVSVEAKTAVEFMKKYGLIEGVGNNTYAPKRTATRAEVAAIFTNVIKALAK